MEDDKPNHLSFQQTSGGVQQATTAFIRLFGEQVRIQRQKLGLKQEDLSELLQSHNIQVSQSYLSRLESGLRSDPSIQIVISLSTILEISLDEIINSAMNS
jgi:transcriptional regulator with XRE-family HTH domain